MRYRSPSDDVALHREPEYGVWTSSPSRVEGDSSMGLIGRDNVTIRLYLDA